MNRPPASAWADSAGEPDRAARPRAIPNADRALPATPPGWGATPEGKAVELTAAPRAPTGSTSKGNSGGGWLAGRWTYLRCLALILPLVACWSLASPMMSGPDEAAGAMWAAAAVRGQFFPPATRVRLGRESAIHLPGDLAGFAGLGDCTFAPGTPASCEHYRALPGDADTVTTQFASYPPLYYLAVGLPTLVEHGLDAGWAERAVGVCCCAALLALGLWALVRYHPRPVVLLGVLAMLTPTLLRYSGLVNASGLEISAGVATWCTLLCLAETDAPPTGLILAATASVVVLVWSRPISPLWAALALATVALLAGRRRLRVLAGDRRLRASAGAGAGALALFGLWRLLAGPTVLLGTAPSPAYSAFGALARSASATPTLLEGLLASLPHQGPATLTWAAWSVLAVALLAPVALAGLRGDRRARRALAIAGALALLVVVIPILAQAVYVNQINLWWESADTLPLAVGVPLVLATGLPRPTGWGRVAAWLVATSAVVVAVSAYGADLARFATGSHGPLLAASYPWQPPGGVLTDAAVLLALVLVSGVVLTRAALGRGVASCPPV